MKLKKTWWNFSLRETKVLIHVRNLIGVYSCNYKHRLNFWREFHTIQKKEESWAFLKNFIKRNGKKINISISRTTLYTQKIKFCMQNFFSKKCLFEYENHFAVEKKQKKIWGQFQKKKFCCRHQKNASHTISIYENCMISIFWQKIFLCYLVRYTKIYAKTREKFFENSMTPF